MNRTLLFRKSAECMRETAPAKTCWWSTASGSRAGQTIYTSATPGVYEIGHSGKPIEQVIRPTGLVDPEIVVRPITSNNQIGHRMSNLYPGQVKDFIAEAEIVTKRGGRL